MLPDRFQARLLVLCNGTIMCWVLFNTTNRLIYNIHLFLVDTQEKNTILLDAIYESDLAEEGMDGEFFELISMRCDAAGLLMSTESGFPDWDVTGELLLNRYPFLVYDLQSAGLLME